MFKINIAIVSFQNLFGLKLHLLQSVVQYFIMKLYYIFLKLKID